MSIKNDLLLGAEAGTMIVLPLALVAGSTDVAAVQVLIAIYLRFVRKGKAIG